MSKPEFKLLPCVFCTIGFNSYVAVNKLTVAATKKIKGKSDQKGIEDENKTARIR